MNNILYTTIDKFFIKTKNEDGSPLINSNNEPYRQVRIKVPEYGDKVLTCYIGNKLKYPARELDMVVGESYWLKIETKEVNDKVFLNFKLASSIAVLEMKQEKNEKQIKFLYDAYKELKDSKVEEKTKISPTVSRTISREEVSQFGKGDEYKYSEDEF